VSTRRFNKRFYTPRSFLRELYGITLALPSIIRTVRSKRISRSFSEKIMLVVTLVNGCRYCDYGHSRMALKSGVRLDELEKLSIFEFKDFQPQQIPALEFARHFAVTNGKPDPISLKRLDDCYGKETSQDIINYIRMITLGNLSGNAADAFISRLKGAPAPESGFVSELVLFVLFAPVIIPLLLVMKFSESKKKKAAALV
jgi:AhpD family alkylhydroperoxidase